MPARTPEELDALFAPALTAGNLDGLLALYERNATLVAQPGYTVTGTAGIREALQGFIAMKPTLTILETKTIAQTDEIALTSSTWRLAGTGSDGHPLTMSGQSAEVARRQADGTWRFVIDSPWGLAWDAPTVT
jgi:ketosteroid isomerase-like protein